MSAILLLAVQAAPPIDVVQTVVIKPRLDDSVWIPPPPSRSVLKKAKAIDWVCKMQTPSEDELVIKGRFHPASFRGDTSIRKVNFRSFGTVDLNGRGTAKWWATRPEAGNYTFEIGTQKRDYKIQLNFLIPGNPGSATMFSSRVRRPDDHTIWQLEGVGLCETSFANWVEVK